MSVRSRHVTLAEGFARQGRMGPAVEACHQALRVGETDPLVHCLLAELMLSGDFYDEAISSASMAIESDPACSPAYLVLGLAYDRRGGMWDRSILVWHELAEVAPDLVTVHVQLGEAFAATAFEEKAIASWKRALELDPTHARAMYDLAIAALKHEGMATALPRFRKAGELDPSQDAFFFRLAGFDDDGPSAASLAKVAPDRDSRLAAAYALAFEDDLLSAAEFTRAILDEDSNDAEVLGLSAYLYLKQGSVNEAMACALRSLTLSTRTPTAVYCLGAAFAKRPGLARHATRVFAALAELTPSEPMPHVLLAESLLALQRYESAGESYRAAITSDPTCVRARFGLAFVLLTEGRHAEADWEIRRAAYHDTRRQGLFWVLYDKYAEGRSG